MKEENKEGENIRRIGIIIFGASIGNLIWALFYLGIYGSEIIGFGTKMTLVGMFSLLWSFMGLCEYQSRKIKMLKKRLKIKYGKSIKRFDL